MREILELKKILYVQHSGGMGGAPRSLSFIINNLGEEFIPYLYLINKGPNYELFKNTINTNNIFIGGKLSFPFHGSEVANPNFRMTINNFLGVLPTYFEAKKIIKRIKPDIIHINSSCMFVFAMAAKKINKNIKVITHIREPILKGIKGYFLKKYTKKYSDYVIAISKNDLKSLGELKIKSKVIYNSIDITKPRYNNFNYLNKKLGISNDSIIFSTLCRIHKSNGIKELIKVAKKIVNENLKFHFVIVGFYENLTAYEHEVKEMVEGQNNIHLLNFTSKVEEIISSSDVIISPFLTPHFSRMVIEASALSKPTIASNVNSQNELVVHNETGFLYNNLNELESYILTLGENEKKRNVFGKNARVMAENNFDTQKNNESLFKIYEELISKELTDK
jgi:glycosyltransferase involved in cell wall biosynthesis